MKLLLAVAAGQALASECTDEDAQQLANLDRDVVRACIAVPMSYDKFNKCMADHGIDISATCSHCWFNVAQLVQTCAKPCHHDMSSAECQHCIESAQDAVGKCMGDENPFALNDYDTFVVELM